MVKPVPGSPALPYPSGRGSSVASLSAFDADLVKALFRILTEMATRINLSVAPELGSFTPVLRFGGATTGITYSVQEASQTLHGDMMFVSGHIVLTSKGSATGNATLTGMRDAGSNAIGQLSNYTFTGSIASPVLTLTTSSAAFRYNNGAVDAPMTDAHFTNTTAFNFNLAYRVA